MSIAERLAKPAQSMPKDRITEIRNRIQGRLVETLGPKLYDASLSDTELEGLVQQRLRELLDEDESGLPARQAPRRSTDRGQRPGAGSARAVRPRLRRYRDHGERLELHLRRARRQDLLERREVPR